MEDDNYKSASHPNSSEYGDFLEIKEETEKKEEPNAEEGSGRIRMPRDGQKVGIVVQRLGGNRMEINCDDGKTRNCRVPGRFKRAFWLRPGDFVLVEVWPDDDYKGDIVFQYKKGDVNQLRKRGLAKGISEGF